MLVNTKSICKIFSGEFIRETGRKSHNLGAVTEIERLVKEIQ